jgi:2-keto-4-pentenoate hydratase
VLRGRLAEWQIPRTQGSWRPESSEVVQVERDPSTVAAALDDARRAGRTLDVEAFEVGDLVSAYAVQRALTSLRLGRGDAVVGWKLGYTTAAMRQQMGIAAPNYGPLLASMQVRGAVPAATLLHPRVEPEIALVLAEDPGRGASPERVLSACARACLALEVVDSVWTDYRFDLEHNTADGSSAAGFVLGDELSLRPATIAVTLVVDGPPSSSGEPTEPVEQGLGSLAAAAESVAWLVGRLDEEGRALRAGDVVLTGGLTRAVPLGAGSVARARASVDGRTAEVLVRGAPLD